MLLTTYGSPFHLVKLGDPFPFNSLVSELFGEQ